MKTDQLNEMVNINKYPSLIESLADKNIQLVVGDLHGNALTLLYILVRHGILEITPPQYALLFQKYSKFLSPLTSKDLNDFNTILNNATFHPNAFVSFIGDCFADRGNNDYFTLLILNHLAKNNIQYEIILSNHDADFICAYETKDKFLPTYLNNGHAMSMVNMQALIDKALIDPDNIKMMIDLCYKPQLKLLSYTLNEDRNEINIATHAGIGIDNIQYIADTLGVAFDDSNAEYLAQSIDRINEKFQLEYVMSNNVHSLFNRPTVEQGYRGLEFSIEQQKNYPIEFLIWNRHYTKLNRVSPYKGYTINYIHGHDFTESSKNNIYNVDNFLGKSMGDYSGKYNIVICENGIHSLENIISLSTDDDTQSIPSVSSSSSTSSSSSSSSSFSGDFLLAQRYLSERGYCPTDSVSTVDPIESPKDKTKTRMHS